MNIAFTLCSNNYLAHAKTLGDSFLSFHPDFSFYIGLVDKWDNKLDPAAFSEFIVLPVEDLKISKFEELNHKYNITELNTAVKPSYLKYFFEKAGAEKVLYIDPDILVESRMEEVIQILDTQNIVVTPHICRPVEDEFAPTDYHTLRGGIFNLGFIGLSQYDQVKEFIYWWHDRVVKYGFVNFSLNMFYDQIWANYIPCFYDNYHILKHPGYNMANWNLHERLLSNQETGNCFLVNTNFPLRFFHFSSYKYNNPGSICAYLTRYNFDTRPDLLPLFQKYSGLLKKNNIEVIQNLEVFYYPKKAAEVSNDAPGFTLLQKAVSRLKRSAKVLLKGYE